MAQYVQFPSPDGGQPADPIVPGDGEQNFTGDIQVTGSYIGPTMGSFSGCSSEPDSASAEGFIWKSTAIDRDTADTDASHSVWKDSAGDIMMRLSGGGGLSFSGGADILTAPSGTMAIGNQGSNSGHWVTPQGVIIIRRSDSPTAGLTIQGANSISAFTSPNLAAGGFKFNAQVADDISTRKAYIWKATNIAKSGFTALTHTEWTDSADAQIALLDPKGKLSLNDGVDSLSTTTAEAPVVITAAPPTTGDVLKATSATVATWQAEGSFPSSTAKSGTVASGSFAGNPKTAAVVFSTAYPDNNYAVSVAAVTTFGFAPTVESKSATGFTINMNANNIAGLTSSEWTTIPHGEG